MRAPVPSEGANLQGIPAARVKLIERIVNAGRTRVPGTSLQLRRRFLRSYFRGVGEEDLSARTPEALAAAALSHLDMARVRAHGRSLVQVFNPGLERDGFSSPHTLVQIVTEDMPF